MPETTTTPERGIRTIRCPDCGDESTLYVQTHDGLVCCNSCSAELTAEDLEARARAYLLLAEWVKAIPSLTFPE